MSKIFKTAFAIFLFTAVASTAAAATILTAPANFEAYFIQNSNNVQLSWSYKSTAKIDGFAIEMAKDDMIFTEIARISAKNQSYIDSKVTTQKNTTIWYRVRAFKGNSYSEYSNIASPSIFYPF